MLSKLPPRERHKVDVLYQQGAMAVSEICEALPVQLSGSAVRAMLKRLEDKGFVQRTDSERGFLFSPVVSENAAKKSALSDIVKTFFNGSGGMKEDELDELEQMIARARQAKGTK